MGPSPDSAISLFRGVGIVGIALGRLAWGRYLNEINDYLVLGSWKYGGIRSELGCKPG